MNREEALEEIKWAKREGGKAHLMYAKLAYVDLSGEDLIGADLREADLHGANLLGADLYGANLRDANLRDANLRGANLRGANLRDANLGNTQVIQIGPMGSRKDYLLAKLFAEGDTEIMTGCFRGTLKQFKESVMENHESGTRYRNEYLSAISLILGIFGLKEVI